MVASNDNCAHTVLVVDDEEDTRELLRELLESRGYAVSTAQDGNAALVALRTDARPCFVLLDVVMPGLDGLGVLATVSADPTLKDVPICMSTSAPERVPQGTPCLPKPIDVDRLFEMVGRFCPRG
jgi:CheY-like chemotaxis protein